MKAQAPDERCVVSLTHRGAQWRVTWGAEAGDEAPSGKRDKPTYWVVLVELGGVWFHAEDALSSDLHDELDAVLSAYKLSA